MPYDAATGDSIHVSFDTEYNSFCGACLDIRLGDEPQVCGIWRAASGDAIDLNMASEYVVPVADVLDFSFQITCYPEYGNVVLPCDEIRPYSIPAGNKIVLEIYREYVPPVGNAIHLELVDCAGDIPPVPPPPWYQIPSDISPGVAIVFGDGGDVSKRIDSPWGGSRVIEPQVSVAFGDSERIERKLDSAWKGLGQLYRKNRIVWARLLSFDHKVQAIWKNLQGKDLPIRIPYGSGVEQDDSIVSDYSCPPEKDQLRGIPFEEALERDAKLFDAPWGNPPAKDRSHETVWGPKYYEEICTRDYLPVAGDELHFDLHKDIEEVGDKDHVDVWFDSLSYDERCNQREPSGWRDAYTYTPVGLIPSGAVRRCYIMNNLVTFTRVSDQAPIQAKSISIGTDFDSFCWSLSTDLGSQEAVDLLQPTESGPVPVAIGINGHDFIVQAESWSPARVFARSVGRAGGRSLSAELAPPEAVTLTFIESNARNAQQIAAAVLEYTGWTLNWQMVDWLIPAGVFSCHEQTPLQIIKTLAEAGGGFVQSDMENKTLIVKPRFSIMPWDWETATPDIIVPEDMMTHINGEWTPRPAYNAAFVSGTVEGGISMKLTRNGTAGDVAAGLVTNPLFTATEVCLAAGKKILAESGKWMKVSCGLPVMTDPEVPGVLLPGMLVSVTGVNPWRGMVASVNVTASWQRSLVVRQAVELWRYYGD